MDTLSIRGQRMQNSVSKLINNAMIVQKNPYDNELNPNGICNCGVAENYLCENEIISKLQTINVWKKDFMYYPDSSGQLTFRKCLCKFFEKNFHLNHKLDPNRMLISSGLTGIISLLSYLIGNKDDVFLIPSPYYTAFDHDISALSNCSIHRCPLLEQDNGKFRFSVEIFQQGYDEVKNQGLQPCGIIIINPQNPTGDIYDQKTIEPMLKFASEKKLHVIIDEIYALSLFENEKPFESILNYKSLIDEKRTHFTWSFSKDFGLSGLRIGVVYAGSYELCKSAAPVNFLQIPSIIVQETLTEFLSDEQWMENFIQINRSRLTKQYEKVRKLVENIDQRIFIRPSKSGFFIWANFSLLLHEISFEEENRLFDIIFDHYLYISPGSVFGCSQPGWFRIIFSVREEWISEAIKRLKTALNIYLNST